MRLLRALLLCCCLQWSQLWAAEQVAVPLLQAPVTDLTGTLTAEQRGVLDAQLRELQSRKGSQLAILMVPTTQPEAIEQYSIRVVDAWKLGRKDVDDGVLLLVAKNDRAVRIEVGYGLEGVLNDATTNRIIRQLIVPSFRNGNYYQGISDASTRIVQLIDGEVLPEPATPTPVRQRGNSQQFPWPVFLFGVLAGGRALRGLFGRFIAAVVAAGGAAIILWLFLGSWLVALIAALFAFFFVLATGGGGGWGGGTPGGWSSGARGGGWGGGLGGGGFSGGGGGGFGGGGASGRW